MLVTFSILCGCTTFGTFSNLEKGKSAKEDIRYLLREPAIKRFEDDKEIWQYYFIKKDQEELGNFQTILILNIAFKKNVVDNYTVSISKEAVQEMQEKIIDKRKEMPPSTKPFQQPKDQSGNFSGNFINEFDLDNDGRVSKKEFSGTSAVFNKFDRNNDGFIDLDEAPEGPPPSGSGRGNDSFKSIR